MTLAQPLEEESDRVPWRQIEAIIVCYHSRLLVEELLTALPHGLAVALIDNSGNADGLLDLVGGHASRRYVDGGGQGFARAANLGAFSSNKPLLLFINPDSRPTPQDLAALVQGLVRDKQAASHAPLTGDNGTIESGVGGWLPTVRRTLVQALGLQKLWPTAGLFAQPRLGEALDVDWTTGDCMVVRAGQFRELGGFDETFYLYAEDMAFGRRARRAGLRTVLREDVVVPHVAETSGSPQLEMFQLRGASFGHYVMRFHSRPSAYAMRTVFAAAYAARAAHQRLTARDKQARLSAAFTRGVLTRRAAVNGVEVSRARYVDTASRPSRRL